MPGTIVYERGARIMKTRKPSAAGRNDMMESNRNPNCMRSVGIVVQASRRIPKHIYLHQVHRLLKSVSDMCAFAKRGLIQSIKMYMLCSDDERFAHRMCWRSGWKWCDVSLASVERPIIVRLSVSVKHHIPWDACKFSFFTGTNICVVWPKKKLSLPSVLFFTIKVEDFGVWKLVLK